MLEDATKSAVVPMFNSFQLLCIKVLALQDEVSVRSKTRLSETHLKEIQRATLTSAVMLQMSLIG